MVRSIGNRLLVSTIALALFGTACTAIVAGKLGDTGDYKKTDSTSTTFGTLDKCSLLKVETQKNACSDCIGTLCKADVEYACQRDGKQEKAWFQKLADCAQSPYLGFQPGNYYDCKDYEDPGEPIAADDDAAKQRNSELCVRNKCLTGATPPCKQCPVNIPKPNVAERAKLAESDCGQCLEEHCMGEIVQCCQTGVVQDELAHCAYTAEGTFKAKCNTLANADAGPSGYGETEEGKACQTTIRTCFQTHCQARCAASK